MSNHPSPQTENWTLACPIQVLKAKAQAEMLWCQYSAQPACLKVASTLTVAILPWPPPAPPRGVWNLAAMGQWSAILGEVHIWEMVSL